MFKKRDVRRAIEAVREAGVDVARVDIDQDGRICIIAGKPQGVEATNNEWDEVTSHGDDQAEARQRILRPVR